MKSIIVAFAAALMVICTPFIFTAIDAGLTDSETQSFSGLTTSSNATVTLGQEAYNDVVGSITSVTSNETADSPTAYSYNSGSRALVVSGLSSSNRTLTVNFLVDDSSLPAGFSTIYVVLRWFWVFGIFGLMGGAIYNFFD